MLLLPANISIKLYGFSFSPRSGTIHHFDFILTRSAVTMLKVAISGDVLQYDLGSLF